MPLGRSTRRTAGGAALRDVPIVWAALEEAFYNNSPSAHSYLHVRTGRVVRVLDGVDDPGVLERIASDADCLRIEPVSSPEQFRWLASYVTTVEDAWLQARLAQAISGKGAFRRFKDIIMAHPEERARWFAFRSTRLRTVGEAWLRAHGLRPIAPEAGEEASLPRRDPRSELLRRRLHAIAETLDARALEALDALAGFLETRDAERRAIHSVSAAQCNTVAGVSGEAD